MIDVYRSNFDVLKEKDVINKIKENYYKQNNDTRILLEQKANLNKKPRFLGFIHDISKG